MGKARILEAHGEGRYTIEIIEARERAEVAKKEAEARIKTLRANIVVLEQRIASAQVTVNQAAAEQDAAINHYQQEMAEEGQSSINLDAFSRVLLEAASQRDALQAEQRTHELRIAADEALVARIDALPPLRQMQAWCADYTEDLSGEVATAEVPGEIGSVIIKPGFEGNAWSAAEDGAMQPTLASTPAASFYNLAMLPGWQKWRPTFRTATLNRLDGDTCSITLDAATSSQQGLGVNAQSSYSNVPIMYMDCNGSAFEEGDKVLVAFAGNVEGPTVVGFEQGPKMCTAFDYITASTQKWPKPDVNYYIEEYTDWTTPESLGMPMSSGNYQISKKIELSNIEADTHISHSDSFVQTGVVKDDTGPYPIGDMTYAFTCDHSCNVTGHVKHLNGELDITYSAKLSGETSYTARGIVVADGKTDWEFTMGPDIGYLKFHDSWPFLSVEEVFTIGEYSIDITKISEHLDSIPELREHVDWIRYYPARSVDSFSNTSLFLRGVTKPYSILLPDIVSFNSDGRKGILIVFSSTGPVTSFSSGGYLYYYPPNYLDSVRGRPQSRIKYHDPDDSYSRGSNYRLSDTKLHVCITLFEDRSGFVRHETPIDVLNYFRMEKVRGNQRDRYYDMPLNVNVS